MLLSSRQLQTSSLCRCFRFSSVWPCRTVGFSKASTGWLKGQPLIETLHSYSDRQKGNFYVLSTEVFERGFSSATWNFHASGHSKGIPDGVGAALKRAADAWGRYHELQIICWWDEQGRENKQALHYWRFWYQSGRKMPLQENIKNYPWYNENASSHCHITRASAVQRCQLHQPQTRQVMEAWRIKRYACQALLENTWNVRCSKSILQHSRPAAHFLHFKRCVKD